MNDKIDYNVGQAIPSNEKLKGVADKVRRVLEVEAEMEALSIQQQAKQEEYHRLTEYDIPEMMTEIGLSEAKLDDGSKLTVKPFYSAKITDENRDGCFEWLRDNGHKAIIKHEVKIALGKGAELEDSYKELLEYLRVKAFGYEDKESVHHSTLTAFVREQVEAASNLPQELFQVFIGRKAKIIVPKKKEKV